MLSCAMRGVAKEASENKILAINWTRNSFESVSPLSHPLIKEQKLPLRKQKKHGVLRLFAMTKVRVILLL